MLKMETDSDSADLSGLKENSFTTTNRSTLRRCSISDSNLVELERKAAGGQLDSSVTRPQDNPSGLAGRFSGFTLSGSLKNLSRRFAKEAQLGNITEGSDKDQGVGSNSGLAHKLVNMMFLEPVSTCERSKSTGELDEPCKSCDSKAESPFRRLNVMAPSGNM